MKKSFVKYIFALLLFGSNGIVASNIHLNSYEIVFFRTLIGSILLLLMFLLSGGKFSFKKHKKDLLFISVSGIAMGLSWMFLYEAYSRVGVSVASLLYYTGPVIVVALSPVLFKERLTKFKITGFAAVLAGIFLINGGQSTELDFYGIICGLLSAVTYAVMVSSNKMSRNISGLENSLIQLAISFLTVAVFVGFKTGYKISAEPHDWVWILILGLINTGLGCYLYFSSIGSLPVQSVAICGYIEPLSAVVFSLIILKESLNLSQIIGAVLIIGGAVFSETVKSKKEQARQ